MKDKRLVSTLLIVVIAIIVVFVVLPLFGYVSVTRSSGS